MPVVFTLRPKFDTSVIPNGRSSFLEVKHSSVRDGPAQLPNPSLEPRELLDRLPQKKASFELSQKIVVALRDQFEAALRSDAKNLPVLSSETVMQGRDYSRVAV